MSKAIRNRTIKIGNAQGIRIPKLRMEWSQAFAAMAEQGDDILLDAVSPTDWERVDWAWDYSH
jgi:antitoxin MazE